MRKFLLGVLAIVTLSTLAGGKYHWDQRVEAVQINGQKEKVVSVQADGEEEKKEKAEEERKRLVKLDKLNYLPPELKNTFKKKIERKESVHLMIMGSSSTSGDDGAWPKELEKALIDTYGHDLIKVTLKEIAEKTSKQVVMEGIHKPLAEMKPDILLLEPFLLYDNGEIRMPDRLKNLETILSDFKKQNPDITFIIQPANPISGAYYYPQEEADLEKYARERKYVYLNHWDSWPDNKSKELKDYLTDENIPNEKGNKVWLDYLMKYFIRG
ncbi:SGNH/GDSL hydrolase family protein [Rossellomorea vietnamensis]|uniref:SGNH/GDSL hydrolase family protein n=1 Tax=Rossellomorea vietnamensis TaxID=218284 RepID=UPI003D2999F6